MQATIVVKMDNEAFADCPTHELARILQELAEKIRDKQSTDIRLRDINGNTVGAYIVKS